MGFLTVESNSTTLSPYRIIAMNHYRIITMEVAMSSRIELEGRLASVASLEESEKQMQRTYA